MFAKTIVVEHMTVLHDKHQLRFCCDNNIVNNEFL